MYVLGHSLFVLYSAQTKFTIPDKMKWKKPSSKDKRQIIEWQKFLLWTCSLFGIGRTFFSFRLLHQQPQQQKSNNKKNTDWAHKRSWQHSLTIFSSNFVVAVSADVIHRFWYETSAPKKIQCSAVNWIFIRVSSWYMPATAHCIRLLLQYFHFGLKQKETGTMASSYREKSSSLGKCSRQ